jgi:hypothetical protein
LASAASLSAFEDEPAEVGGAELLGIFSTRVQKVLKNLAVLIQGS